MTDREQIVETGNLIREALQLGIENPDEKLEKEMMRAMYIPNGEKAGEALEIALKKITESEEREHDRTNNPSHHSHSDTGLDMDLHDE